MARSPSDADRKKSGWRGDARQGRLRRITPARRRMSGERFWQSRPFSIRVPGPSSTCVDSPAVSSPRSGCNSSGFLFPATRSSVPALFLPHISAPGSEKVRFEQSWGVFGGARRGVRGKRRRPLTATPSPAPYGPNLHPHPNKPDAPSSNPDSSLTTPFASAYTLPRKLLGFLHRSGRHPGAGAVTSFSKRIDELYCHHLWGTAETTRKYKDASCFMSLFKM